MDIQVGAVSRRGPHQAIHIRTGTALQGQLHATVRRQQDFAGRFRVDGDGRVTFDSDVLAVAAASAVGPRAQRDLAIIRSAQGRYYVEPLVENLHRRGTGELYLRAEVLRVEGHVGAELTQVVLADAPEEILAVQAR